jgi:multiple sugar transport system substrate-binding protein
MTTEIEFSIMMDRQAAELIQPLLDQFEAETDIRVRLRLLNWDSGWGELIRVALYGDGPDVSEIGTTWLGDLVAMNALHPYRHGDIAAVGGVGSFLASAWGGTHLLGQRDTWAIPWVTGVRLLFYRRSLFQKAGVEEVTAFDSARQLDDTLNTLHAAGVPVPWTVPTGVTHTTLLNAASWVWGAGGDFLSPDARQTVFNQPEAREGLRAYYALGRFLAPQVQYLNGLEPDHQFLEDAGTAMTLSGPWLYQQASEKLRNDLGIALPPGALFLGGSHLVLWRHTTHTEAAVRLIRFLTRPEIQTVYCQRVGLLPVKLETLGRAPYATEPLWRAATAGLKSARSFPLTRSWGLMEDRLTNVLAAIWDDVLKTPDADLNMIIARHLDPLARRLDLVLGQT